MIQYKYTRAHDFLTKVEKTHQHFIIWSMCSNFVFLYNKPIKNGLKEKKKISPFCRLCKVAADGLRLNVYRECGGLFFFLPPNIYMALLLFDRVAATRAINTLGNKINNGFLSVDGWKQIHVGVHGSLINTHTYVCFLYIYSFQLYIT